MRSDLIVRIISATLSAALTVCAAVCFAPSAQLSAKALSASEMKDKIASYEQKEKELENKIDSLEDDKDEAQQLADTLESKIDNLQSQIDLVNSQLSRLNGQIAESEAKIEKLKDNIEQQKQLLKDRLRAIYIAGTNSGLQVLLSAADLADYLAKAELMRGVTDHDKKLMDRMNRDVKQINKEKKAVQAKKADVSSLKQTLVSKQNELDADYASAQGVYSSISSKQDSLAGEQAKIEAQRKALEKEFAAAIASNSDTNLVLSSMNFAWPIQSSYYISCYYGQQSYRFHTGVDLAGGGIYGKPIVAIADGRVIKATYLTYSYGNHMIIDHGNKDGNQYSSLYAHCSSLAVSYGQEVKKGQVIGYVGSTGNSTGPHLHFEIRVNGSCSNPLNYYSGY